MLESYPYFFLRLKQKEGRDLKEQKFFVLFGNIFQKKHPFVMNVLINITFFSVGFEVGLKFWWKFDESLAENDLKIACQ